MNETSGVLRPAVLAYLDGEDMTDAQVAALRAYLRQWMAGPWLPVDQVEQLRADIPALATREEFRNWFDLAADCGIDPL